MELKEKIREALRGVYGNFETDLEIEYETKITNNLLNGNRKDRVEWATYNQVMVELKHNVNNMLKVKQLQYELTDDTDPSEVCINIIDGLRVKSIELDRLYDKIMDFYPKY